MKFTTTILSASLLLAGQAALASFAAAADQNLDALLFADRSGSGWAPQDMEAQQRRRNVEERFTHGRRRAAAAAIASPNKKRGSTKSCKAKAVSNNKNAAKAAQPTGQPQSGKHSSTTHSATAAAQTKTSSDNDDDDDEDSSSTKSSTSSSSSNKGSGSTTLGSIGSGLIGAFFGNAACKNPKADNSHPNGSPGFLSCGISSSNPNSAWSPAHVPMSSLKMISSTAAAATSVFAPCAAHKWAFDQASDQTGLPAVLLMSFALQESTCNPGETGPNGEIGMMQITPDKCRQSNCYETGYNVLTGAKYFKGVLDGQCGGNALCAIGQYNGWSPGLTYARATNKQWGCYAQNNLDYLNQLLNGFTQGKNGQDSSFKQFNNLAVCG